MVANGGQRQRRRKKGAKKKGENLLGWSILNEIYRKRRDNDGNRCPNIYLKNDHHLFNLQQVNFQL
jgi:hypothetical protein